MNGHANEEGDNGLILLPQPLFSLPEDTLIPFVLTWGAACWLAWLPICKNKLGGVRDMVAGRPNHLVPSSQHGSCSSPTAVSSLSTDWDLEW